MVCKYTRPRRPKTNTRGQTKACNLTRGGQFQLPAYYLHRVETPCRSPNRKDGPRARLDARPRVRRAPPPPPRGGRRGQGQDEDFEEGCAPAARPSAAARRSARSPRPRGAARARPLTPAARRRSWGPAEAAQIVAIYEANPKILTVIRELIKDMEHWKRAKEGKGRRGLLQTVTPSYNTSYTDGALPPAPRSAASPSRSMPTPRTLPPRPPTISLALQVMATHTRGPGLTSGEPAEQRAVCLARSPPRPIALVTHAPVPPPLASARRRSATSTSSSYCTGTTANCAGQKCCSCCTTPKGYIDCDPPQTVGTCCTCPPTPSPPPPIPTSCCANIFQSSKTCANPCQSPTICTDAVTVSGYCDGNSGYSSEITCVSTFCT